MIFECYLPVGSGGGSAADVFDLLIVDRLNESLINFGKDFLKFIDLNKNKI
jgi:hypothetical protein